jgi:hypothetical protein
LRTELAMTLTVVSLVDDGPRAAYAGHLERPVPQFSR